MTRRLRFLPLLLALVLVAAQALGLMHRVLHAQTAQTHEPHSIASLFDAHDPGDAGCRLFDPLNHEGAPTVAVVLLPLVLSSFFVASLQGGVLARWAALFDARGPPSLR